MMPPPELPQHIADHVAGHVTTNRPQILSTYRLQFHREFAFREAIELLPYLRELGISHVYASPYLRARQGSGHGYDVCDHNAINPELGGESAFREFVGALRAHGMGHIVDFVPNHMSASTENPWWADVLENGPSSPYSHYFDIEWRPEKSELTNKVLLPILGGQYGDVLESGQLVLEHSDGSFVLRYFDHVLPIDPKTTVPLLQHRLEDLQVRLSDAPDAFDEYQSIVTALQKLPAQTATSPAAITERQREKEVIKRRLKRLESEHPAVADFITENVKAFNGQAGDSPSFDRLDVLLSQQPYRLSHWRVASDDINYRRFFDINELAAICMEQPDVFEHTHRTIIGLLASGDVDGVRLDHIDGLFDPLQYLWRLQRAYVAELGRQVWIREFAPPVPAGDDGSANAARWAEIRPEFLRALAERLRLPEIRDEADDSLPPLDAGQNTVMPEWAIQRTALPLHVWAEKILGPDEPLPLDWPVAGTTGYDFLNLISWLSLESEGFAEIARHYRRFTGVSTDYAVIVEHCKRLILRVSMASELQMLAQRLNRISEQHRSTRDFTLNSLRFVLREVLESFPVYRTYSARGRISERDRRFIHLALARARRNNPALDASLFEFIRKLLLLEHPEGLSESAIRERELFTGRFHQVTSPLMAKGVEDTAFYVYCPLLSLNEVGGAPAASEVTVAGFHRDNLHRRREWPESLLASSTHDTKRSEDVRARLQVLSERARSWRTAFNRWSRLNRRLVREVDGLPAPSRNDEYLFYQSLVGVWPAHPIDESEGELLVARLTQYMEKATREAKVRTSWISPNAAYDEAVRDFVARVLEPRRDNRFFHEMSAFVNELADFGAWTALSQVLLKLLSPGVPDIYRGQEIWDFSLVDPDNRRPVDFALRQRMLSELRTSIEQGPEHHLSLAHELARSPQDPRSKLLVTWRAMRLRMDHPELFVKGEYVPLEVTGDRAEHIVAFAWRLPVDESGSLHLIVIAPRWYAKLADTSGISPFVPVGADVWLNTQVSVPGLEQRDFENTLTGRRLALGSHVSVSEALSDFPLAALISR